MLAGACDLIPISTNDMISETRLEQQGRATGQSLTSFHPLNFNMGADICQSFGAGELPPQRSNVYIYFRFSIPASVGLPVSLFPASR